MSPLKILLIILILVIPACAVTYTDTTEQSLIRGEDTFSGTVDITFDAPSEGSFPAQAIFKFIEQGWTIKVKSQLTGVTDGTGVTLTGKTPLKYSGKEYLLSTTVHATYDPVSDTYSGVKKFSLSGICEDGREFPFNAKT